MVDTSVGTVLEFDISVMFLEGFALIFVLSSLDFGLLLMFLVEFLGVGLQLVQVGHVASVDVLLSGDFLDLLVQSPNVVTFVVLVRGSALAVGVAAGSFGFVLDPELLCVVQLLLSIGRARIVR